MNYSSVLRVASLHVSPEAWGWADGGVASGSCTERRDPHPSPFPPFHICLAHKHQERCHSDPFDDCFSAVDGSQHLERIGIVNKTTRVLRGLFRKLLFYDCIWMGFSQEQEPSSVSGIAFSIYLMKVRRQVAACD